MIIDIMFIVFKFVFKNMNRFSNRNFSICVSVQGFTTLFGTPRIETDEEFAKRAVDFAEHGMSTAKYLVSHSKLRSLTAHLIAAGHALNNHQQGASSLGKIRIALSNMLNERASHILSADKFDGEVSEVHKLLDQAPQLGLKLLYHLHLKVINHLPLFC